MQHVENTLILMELLKPNQSAMIITAVEAINMKLHTFHTPTYRRHQDIRPHLVKKIWLF